MRSIIGEWFAFLGKCILWPWGVYKNLKAIVGLAVLVAALAGLATVEPAGELVLKAIGVLYLLGALVIAPFVLWRREQWKARTAEEALKPTLRVETFIKQEERGSVSCIRVENPNPGKVDSCVGVLRGVYTLSANRGKEALDLRIPALIFRWSEDLTDTPNNPQHTFSVVADLRIAMPENSWGKCQVRLLSFHPQRIVSGRQESGDLFLPAYPQYVLDIEIKGENTPSLRQDYLLEVQFPEDVGHSNGGGGWSPGPQPETLSFQLYREKIKEPVSILPHGRK